MFVKLLTGLVTGSNHTKCVSLSNQKYMNQPTLIKFHPNEYSHALHHYQFVVSLDRCIGSCNTFNGLFNKVCVPNKTKGSNLCFFNMITGQNE